MPGRWKVWIDTGGTFTDCVAVDPSGGTHRAKVLSSGALRGRVKRGAGPRRLIVERPWAVPDDFVRGFGFRPLDRERTSATATAWDASSGTLELDEDPGGEVSSFELDSGLEAPLLAARMVTGTPPGSDLPGIDMRLATTRGTNALLERRGADVALFVTRGLGDLLLIGDQQRPELFALRIERPPPLYREVVEVEERLAADGSVVTPLRLDDAAAAARRLRQRGVRAAAVALLHAYRNPAHERALAAMLREAGFEHVSCSAELSPLIRLLPRAETAVVNAYLAPLIEAYLKRIGSALRGGRLHLMTSAGGLVGAARARACDSLLSGPAGGVAGGAAAGRRSGFDRVIGFDMGGTSTDVARYDGDYEYRFEHRVGGTRLLAPALAIETVAAGGGSICAFTAGKLRVGPRSASASPGPACYGAGGPLTLTDVNLLLGRLDADRFGVPVSVPAARAALEDVRRAVAGHGGAVPEAESLLEGFLAIADQRMADAIGEVSLRRGYDPRDYALVAFGGAGGQHACAVAGHLGIGTVVLPADASLLSAVGLGRAPVERFAEEQVLRRLDEVRDELGGRLEELARRARADVEAQGVAAGEIEVRRRIANLRLAGQAASIAIERPDALEEEFERRYVAMYGHAPRGTIEVESLRVIASSAAPADAEAESAVAAQPVTAARRVRSRIGGAWREVPAWRRDELPAGATFEGPALVFDDLTACVVEPGWSARVDGAGALVLEPGDTGGGQRPHDGTAGAPAVVRRELFANRLSSVAVQMGRQLERTALSTNVKERLDFSCALLDAGGELVVHAPHMPVHLGSLGLCVRAVREAVEMAPGDVVVTNHPGCGGSHVPDVTVVTPIHSAGSLVGYAASRAHHAEIGGTRPGSMPPLATSLADEGVVIPPLHLVRGGEADFAALERRLREAPYPSRAVSDNLADIRAQIAANRHGAAAVEGLAEREGVEAVAEQMAALKARAEHLAREALSGLPDDRYEAEERLDDGAAIRVAIDLSGDRAVIDFAGSADVHPGNLNATPAVVRSAVIYVLRCLIGEALPLNEGIMRAVGVRIPPGMLAPRFPADPRAAPAVGGGNVETSQRIVDVLLKALRACAGSQGTMNNTLFGTERFSYYETVCGGSGAGPDFDGADAVHTHMTNTRITDAEILEHRYPVRLARFALRRGSGGAGRHRGGDGAVREIEFLEAMSLSLLTQHRRAGPFGLDGGAPGAAGRHWIERAGGAREALGPVDGAEVAAGDRLVMETPGGGGFGPPEAAGG